MLRRTLAAIRAGELIWLNRKLATGRPAGGLASELASELTGRAAEREWRHAVVVGARCPSLSGMSCPRRNFAIFDDASPGAGPALLFEKPIDVIAVWDAAGVKPALERVRQAGRDGLWCAGFIGYEAGYALEPKLSGLVGDPSQHPLLWFGIFDAPRPFDDWPQLATGTVEECFDLAASPLIAEGDYLASVDQVLGYVRAGDIYQVNFTYQAQLGAVPDPSALYAVLRRRQASRHGVLLATGSETIVCLSPELFFDLHAGRITTRPMKGTAARSDDPVHDREAAARLAQDAKNRAENLMIVDLMRNDVARIAAPGSVRVDRLFEIESYPTLHQMTSTVSAQLRDGLDAVDVIETLFPCGSITGAPKIRAMQLIQQIEARPRGVYTGSIGWISPDGDARFNVAIRTVVIDRTGRARIGLGSGLVADSVGEDEWEECLLKGRFLARAAVPA